MDVAMTQAMRLAATDASVGLAVPWMESMPQLGAAAASRESSWRSLIDITTAQAALKPPIIVYGTFGTTQAGRQDNQDAFQRAWVDYARVFTTRSPAPVDKPLRLGALSILGAALNRALNRQISSVRSLLALLVAATTAASSASGAAEWLNPFLADGDASFISVGLSGLLALFLGLFLSEYIRFDAKAELLPEDGKPGGSNVR
jgi:hypothetical protein